MNPFVRTNRDLWDEWAEINYRSKYYDVDGFKAKRPPLDAIVRTSLGTLTDTRVLHLQCHFGMDTIRLAEAGADVVGVDFSPKAIALARELAFEVGSPARFIESDILALTDVLDEEFDCVFASYGVVQWLPALDRWASVIARFLIPGGRFVLADSHPTMMMFDGETDAPRVAYGYFHTPAPLRFEPRIGNYADPGATYTSTEHSWQHSMSDIVMALIGAGLRIDELREYPYSTWRALNYLVESEPERWTTPPGVPELPLSFSLRASKR